MGGEVDSSFSRAGLPKTTNTVTVDNPGAGNCAFYAFSIGLMEIIQEEARAGNSWRFDKWCELDEKIKEHKERILNYNFTIRNFDKPLLDILQRSLRNIIYNTRLKELEKGKEFLLEKTDEGIKYRNFGRISAVTLFEQFVANPDDNTGYNPLAGTNKVVVKKLINAGPKQQNPSNWQALACFLKDVYGDKYDTSPENPDPSKSKIIAALQDVTKEYLWGTHSDLNFLAEQFELNYHCQNQTTTYAYKDKTECLMFKTEQLPPIEEAKKQYKQNSVVFSVNEKLHYFNPQANQFLEITKNQTNGVNYYRLMAAVEGSSFIRSLDNDHYEYLKNLIPPEQLPKLKPILSVRNESNVHWVTLVNATNHALSAARKTSARLASVVKIDEQQDRDKSESQETIEDIAGLFTQYEENNASHPETREPLHKKQNKIQSTEEQLKNKLCEPITKKDIYKEMASYVHGIKALFGRHHADKATEILKDCENENVSIESILNKLHIYAQDKAINKNGSFFKRIVTIKAKDFDSDITKEQIKVLFENYRRPLYSFFTRHHLKEAKDIMRWCNDAIEDVHSIMEKINTLNIKFKPNSEFLKITQGLIGRYNSNPENFKAIKTTPRQ